VSSRRRPDRSMVLVIARTDLKQLIQSPDFWVPMAILATLFFVLAPVALLYAVTHAQAAPLVTRIASTLQVLPEKAQRAVHGASPEGKTAYALAVYLFAPLAIIVPMTISTAIGANTLVGERERGTGEFLAHSPASESEIYLGKLVASLLPGYLTTLVGFGVYALIVNTLVGPRVGGWFFPTTDWWVLVLWVVPPFLALTLSAVLWLSGRVRSAAAAQQASGLVTLPLIMLSFALSSGSAFAAGGGFVIGLLAWVAAGLGLARGARSVRRGRLLGVEAR
jgi:ABC-2 type transport system permease protein